MSTQIVWMESWSQILYISNHYFFNGLLCKLGNNRKNLKAGSVSNIVLWVGLLQFCGVKSWIPHNLKTHKAVFKQIVIFYFFRFSGGFATFPPKATITFEFQAKFPAFWETNFEFHVKNGGPQFNWFFTL